MFLNLQSSEQKIYYEKMLKIIGSLSGIYSDSDAPYLNYRTTENLFCKAFDAENLSRGDSSADASKNGVGFGIKTFLTGDGSSLQKVAEFNRDFSSFSTLEPHAVIEKISELRNERINATKRIYGLDNIIYHCITRDTGRIRIFETPMDNIDLSKIRDVKQVNGGRSIKFQDNLHEYTFNITKSTLYKRFKIENILMQIPVKILIDPFDALQALLGEIGNDITFADIHEQEHVFLPLYSTQGGTKNVPKKSGLNQWNAEGRARDPNEIYIPIPAWIHNKFPDFFPPRDESFELKLPNGNALDAKVCQEGSKALMSNPNKALGEWLLRNVMNLPEGALLTIEQLDTLGIDSVVVYKIGNGMYSIDFTKTGSFDDFKDSIDTNSDIDENTEA